MTFCSMLLAISYDGAVVSRSPGVWAVGGFGGRGGGGRWVVGGGVPDGHAVLVLTWVVLPRAVPPVAS